MVAVRATPRRRTSSRGSPRPPRRAGRPGPSRRPRRARGGWPGTARRTPRRSAAACRPRPAAHRAPLPAGRSAPRQERSESGTGGRARHARHRTEHERVEQHPHALGPCRRHRDNRDRPTGRPGIPEMSPGAIPLGGDGPPRSRMWSATGADGTCWHLYSRPGPLSRVKIWRVPEVAYVTVWSRSRTAAWDRREEPRSSMSAAMGGTCPASAASRL
jgi:hypothetical protein